jgi:hypothetical protein
LLVYSSISAGWQSKTLQIASRVLNRIAFAFPVLSMDRLARVMSTFSESSFKDIFRFAIITSRFTIIGMAYTVNSFSDWISIPLLKTKDITNTMAAKNKNSGPPPRYDKSVFRTTPFPLNHKA